VDQDASPVAAPDPPQQKAMNATRALAFQLFRDGAAIEDVIHQTGRARTTILDYLADYIRQEKPASVDTWVAPDQYQRIAAAIKEHGSARLKPIFIALDEKVPYDEIRVVVAHLG
jgi:ATP-dependent DNA helicase RecQ